jgi:hypothetical protein
MPHLITNPGCRQCHPLYKQKSNGKQDTASVHGKKAYDNTEQTTAIPKTYDAIKSAAGADSKVKGKK